jgi:hypothetical protein
MPIDPTRPVVAVFGSNAPSEGERAAARLLGAAVNACGAVLLTGGDGSEPRTVKDAAIDAATEAAEDAVENEPADRAPAAWIGVANTGHAGPPSWQGPSSVVVRPGWGHRRNFVEACLCDAALAVGVSSPGTASEVLFSSYVGRPVVVLGDVSPESVHPRALHRLALTRIGQPTSFAWAVDRGIRHAYAWAAVGDTRAQVRPLPPDRAAAEELVTALLARVRTPAPRLDIDATADEASWDACVDGCLSLRGGG